MSHEDDDPRRAGQGIPAKSRPAGKSGDPGAGAGSRIFAFDVVDTRDDGSALTAPREFDVALLDRVVTAAYDPTSPLRDAANQQLMVLQEDPDLWTKADAILERSQNPQARYFGLQVLSDAIRVR